MFYELFFFFKQKTAYEMRISDWSSDVCSSDLYPHHASQIDIADLAALDAALDMQFLNRTLFYQRDPRFKRGDIDQDIFAHVQMSREIGSASCRERVCQYV